MSVFTWMDKKLFKSQEWQEIPLLNRKDLDEIGKRATTALVDALSHITTRLTNIEESLAAIRQDNAVIQAQNLKVLVRVKRRRRK